MDSNKAVYDQVKEGSNGHDTPSSEITVGSSNHTYLTSNRKTLNRILCTVNGQLRKGLLAWKLTIQCLLEIHIYYSVYVR